MAWYDHYYNCTDKLLSGKYGVQAVLDSPFKPGSLAARNVYLFHGLFVLPLFMFLTYGKGGLYELGFYIALFGFVYHWWRFLQYTNA